MILAGIMGYAAMFSANGTHYPIPSSMQMLNQGKDISAGLSRSFSELVRGRIHRSREYNEYGPRIFLFFLLQLLMRPLFAFFYLKQHQAVKWIYLDAGISIVLFVMAFLPFIKRLTEIMFNS